jgi:hypothetical protein
MDFINSITVIHEEKTKKSDELIESIGIYLDHSYVWKDLLTSRMHEHVFDLLKKRKSLKNIQKETYQITSKVYHHN